MLNGRANSKREYRFTRVAAEHKPFTRVYANEILQ